MGPAAGFFLGALLGAIIGGAAGFGGGLLWTELSGTSGFEGYAGFVVAYWLIAGIVTGFIGGGVAGFLIAGRRKDAIKD